MSGQAGTRAADLSPRPGPSDGRLARQCSGHYGDRVGAGVASNGSRWGHTVCFLNFKPWGLQAKKERLLSSFFFLS